MHLISENKKTSRVLAGEEASAKLLELIVEGKLLPGQKILDRELSKQLNLGRTPIREALQRLAAQGYVETLPGRWTKISDTDPGDGKLLFPVISNLEIIALENGFAKMTEKDFQKMETFNDQLKKAIFNGEKIVACKADRAFHWVFIEKYNNPFLQEIISDLNYRHLRMEINYFRDINDALKSPEEHVAFIDALREGNLTLAKACLVENWHNSIGRILRGAEVTKKQFK
jgi:DNA-binding GntR family transcriptional regulator